MIITVTKIWEQKQAHFQLHFGTKLQNEDTFWKLQYLCFLVCTTGTRWGNCSSLYMCNWYEYLNRIRRIPSDVYLLPYNYTNQGSIYSYIKHDGWISLRNKKNKNQELSWTLKTCKKNKQNGGSVYLDIG